MSTAWSIALLVATMAWCTVATSLAGSADIGDKPDLARVYLIYAGPYASSPSSAFGHLFLGLEPTTPTPPTLWNVVGFSALATDENPVRYFFTGIFGGYLGCFRTQEFHEVHREYGALEDRDLWFLPIRASRAELSALASRITEVEGQARPYSFFQRNCAYYMLELLSEVLSDVPPPQGAVSPIEVFDLLAQRRGGNDVYFRASLTEVLRDGVASSSRAFRDHLTQRSWTELVTDQRWVDTLPIQERSLLHRLAAARLLHSSDPPTSSVVEGVQHLRVLNSFGSSAIAAPTRSLGATVDTPEFHSYARGSAAWQSNREEGTSVQLRFRPGVHDLDEDWVGHRPINTLELLTLEIGILPRTQTVRVEEFCLFAQRSMPAHDSVAPSNAWCFNSAFRRGTFRESRVGEVVLEAGVGRRLHLPSLGSLHGFVLGTVHGSSMVHVRALPGIELGYLTPVTRQIRGGLDGTVYRGLGDHLREPPPYEVESWLSTSLGGLNLLTSWRVTRFVSAAKVQISTYL